MARESRLYWAAQLSEYGESGLTVQEYRELKDLPYETIRNVRSHKLLLFFDQQSTAIVDNGELRSSSASDSALIAKSSPSEDVIRRYAETITCPPRCTAFLANPA